MIDPLLIFYILLGLGAIWTAIWLWIVLGVRRRAAAQVELEAAALRRRLIYPMLGVLGIGLLVSLYWLPYPGIRARTLGQPKVIVSVKGVQWAWIMSATSVPAHVPIAFDVTALDVNHGFAIYSPQGRLLTQVQAMPGYTNRLIYEFDRPGTYTVRCLEYCGLGHDIMLRRLTVV